MKLIRHPRLTIVALNLWAALAVTVSGCDSDSRHRARQPEALPSVPVEAVEATVAVPARQVEIMGTVQAADRASIAAKISGNITRLPVKLGSRVEKGALLAAISAGEISAKLLQAQAQLDQAERNLKRERNLLAQNAATPETVKSLEEARQIARAAYDEARTMLSYATITAPFDGIITSKSANVGDLATPGRELLELEGEDRLQVITDVPEAMILDLNLGDTLEVAIPAAGLNLAGSIVEIAPTADPRSRTAPVKLDLPADPKLRSGQFARVSLPSNRGEAILVPAAAVLQFGQMERIFVIRDGYAQLQLVKTGLHHGDTVEILAGLEAGDQVAIAGHQHLRDGQPVILR